jgi:hypothetical protein
MFDIKELDELIKSEELQKNRAALKAVLNHAAILHDSGASTEQKAIAAEKIKEIVGAGGRKKRYADPKMRQQVDQIRESKKPNPLEGPLKEATKEHEASFDKDIKRKIKNINFQQREFEVGQQEQQRKEQKQKRQEQKQKQLEANKPFDKLQPSFDLLPDKEKIQHTVRKAFNLVDKLHDSSDHDNAHKILSNIQTEDYPKEYKDYHFS